MEEVVEWSYNQGIKVDGHSLRIYNSKYHGFTIFKQIDTRYDIRTGFILENKKPKIIYFPDEDIFGKDCEFKTLEELQDFLRSSI